MLPLCRRISLPTWRPGNRGRVTWRERANVLGDSGPRARGGTCGPDATEAQVQAPNLGRTTDGMLGRCGQRGRGRQGESAESAALPRPGFRPPARLHQPRLRLRRSGAAGSPPGHLPAALEATGDGGRGGNICSIVLVRSRSSVPIGDPGTCSPRSTSNYRKIEIVSS